MEMILIKQPGDTIPMPGRTLGKTHEATSGRFANTGVRLAGGELGIGIHLQWRGMPSAERDGPCVSSSSLFEAAQTTDLGSKWGDKGIGTLLKAPQ